MPGLAEAYALTTEERYRAHVPMYGDATGTKAGGNGRLILWLVAVSWPGLLSVPAPVTAADEVKSAVIVPLSGRWARQGELYKAGSDMAAAEINAQGSIASLGRARIVLVSADAGDSVQKATSAAQRVLGRDEVAAAQGSWLSSFTLGATEVSERLGIPWITHSWSDKITDRGFKYVFQSSSVSSQLAEQGIFPTLLLWCNSCAQASRIS